MFGAGHMATILPPTIGAGPGHLPAEPSAARGAGFGRGASRRVSGRVAADDAAVFTVKGKRRFKGAAREVSVGGMRAGRPRILFPGRWLERRTDAVRAAVRVRSTSPLGG